MLLVFLRQKLEIQVRWYFWNITGQMSSVQIICMQIRFNHHPILPHWPFPSQNVNLSLQTLPIWKSECPCHKWIGASCNHLSQLFLFRLDQRLEDGKDMFRCLSEKHVGESGHVQLNTSVESDIKTMETNQKTLVKQNKKIWNEELLRDCNSERLQLRLLPISLRGRKLEICISILSVSDIALELLMYLKFYYWIPSCSNSDMFHSPILSPSSLQYSTRQPVEIKRIWTWKFLRNGKWRKFSFCSDANLLNSPQWILKLTPYPHLQKKIGHLQLSEARQRHEMMSSRIQT